MQYRLGLFVGLFFAAGAIQSVGAAQIAIDPQCSGMAHKVSCTCALRNGGHIGSKNQGEMRWFVAHNMQDAVDACVKAAGGEHVY